MDLVIHLSKFYELNCCIYTRNVAMHVIFSVFDGREQGGVTEIFPKKLYRAKVIKLNMYVR